MGTCARPLLPNLDNIPITSHGKVLPMRTECQQVCVFLLNWLTCLTKRTRLPSGPESYLFPSVNGRKIVTNGAECYGVNFFIVGNLCKYGRCTGLIIFHYPGSSVFKRDAEKTTDRK